jgi:hypothetical protein
MGWSTVKSNKFKLLSGVVGASAVVTMVALTVAVGQQPEEGRVVSEDPTATIGETVTSTAGQTELETSVATPPFTFTTPPGFAAPH